MESQADPREDRRVQGSNDTLICSLQETIVRNNAKCLPQLDPDQKVLAPQYCYVSLMYGPHMYILTKPLPPAVVWHFLLASRSLCFYSNWSHEWELLADPMSKEHRYSNAVSARACQHCWIHAITLIRKAGRRTHCPLCIQSHQANALMIRKMIASSLSMHHLFTSCTYFPNSGAIYSTCSFIFASDPLKIYPESQSFVMHL